MERPSDDATRDQDDFVDQENYDDSDDVIYEKEDPYDDYRVEDDEEFEELDFDISQREIGHHGYTNDQEEDEE